LPVPSLGASPEEIVIASERQRALRTHLDALGERDRSVIEFRYFSDLSEEETAEVLGVPKGTVKSRLSRAMERLRERLNAEWRGDHE
jgi:RNA polymerase sigma-70 factor (ECF subfamily)